MSDDDEAREPWDMYRWYGLDPDDVRRVEASLSGCSSAGRDPSCVCPLHASLREGARGSRGSALARTRNALVLAEVAVALVLSMGAGLLIRSFDKLTRVDLGFQPAGVLTYSVTFPSAKFRETAQLPAIYESIIERSR